MQSRLLVEEFDDEFIKQGSSVIHRCPMIQEKIDQAK